jgi:hypothetical protein
LLLTIIYTLVIYLKGIENLGAPKVNQAKGAPLGAGLTSKNRLSYIMNEVSQVVIVQD